MLDVATVSFESVRCEMRQPSRLCTRPGDMVPVVLLGVDTFSKFWNSGLTEWTMVDLVSYTSSFSCFATDLLPKS
jgi:hypothetical protein